MAGTSTPHRSERIEKVSETVEVESAEDFAQNIAIYATRPIRTEEEYDHARSIIARLLHGAHEPGSWAYDLLEVLSLLIEDYDSKNVPEFRDATPQEMVQFMAEQRGMKTPELADLMGGRSRLSEFMRGKRSLSITQVRSLRDELGIPADLLIE